MTDYTGKYDGYSYDDFVAEIAELEQYKQAIDEQLIAIDSCVESFASAKDAVNSLIDWHVANERRYMRENDG